MPAQLLKQHSIDIKQKLFEKDVPQGKLAVYQTALFGRIVMMNNDVIFSEQDSFFYHEMMSHPVLFTHPQAEHVAIVGNSVGIVDEVLKHPSVKEITCIDTNTEFYDVVKTYLSSLSFNNDPRVTHHHVDHPEEWVKKIEPQTFDVIIQTQAISDSLLNHYHRVLSADGIVAQSCEFSILQLNEMKSRYKNIQSAGFNGQQTLTFAQPSYALGPRIIILATKRTTFKPVREKDVFNRPFTTRYYNYDVHRASLTVPEFMRD